ncbi:insulinase family protein, partial [Acinetobacter baumannii]
MAFATAFVTLGLARVSIQPATAQTAPQRPTTFTLSNGLNVIVIPDRRTPVVTQMIWYKVGSADETPGKSGLA